MKSGLRGVLVLVAGSVFAQAPRPITLEETLKTADAMNPRLRATSALVEGSQAAITTATAYPNPTLSFGSMGRQRVVFPGNVGGWLHGVTFTQPLELPSLRSARIDVAQVGRRSSDIAMKETRLAIHAAVKQAFYEVLRRKAEMEVAQGTVQLLEDLRRRISVQVKVGEAAKLELTRGDAEVSAARVQLRAAELRHVGALSALSAAVGTPLGRVEPAAALEPPPALPPLETLRQEVLASHPAVALAESEVRRSEAILNYEKAQKKPQPSVWVDVFHQPDVAQYRFGVALNLPIRNKREGPIAEAVAATHAAAAIAQQRRMEITAALESAYNLYQVAGQQVEMFEAGTLRGAEAAVAAAEAAFRFGERGIIEVLDAQRVLRATRLDYLNSQFDRQLALIELERLGVVNLQGGKP